MNDDQIWYVLDTSVIIKWFRQEEILANQALAIRAAYLRGQSNVSLPLLGLYELATVLRYKSDLSTQQAQELVQAILDMGLDWHLPTGAEMRRAIEIARTYDIAVYDAVFIALAESLGAILVTADERLAQRLNDLAYVRFLGNMELLAN